MLLCVDTCAATTLVSSIESFGVYFEAANTAGETITIDCNSFRGAEAVITAHDSSFDV